MSHHVGTERADTTLERAMDDDYARDVVCSVILLELEKVPFACVVALQEDPWRMWKSYTSGTARIRRSAKWRYILHKCELNTLEKPCKTNTRGELR